MSKKKGDVEEESLEDSNRVVRFGVSIPIDLLKEFDEAISQMGMKRSKAIRLAMRKFLADRNWQCGSGDVVGTVNILYDHEVRGLDEYLTEIQHDYLDIVLSNTHIHLDKEHCMLIIIVKGNVKRIKELIDKVSSKKGVKQVKTVVNPVS